MHFCIKCGNMYYIKIDDNEELTYNCRKCGHKNSWQNCHNSKS